MQSDLTSLPGRGGAWMRDLGEEAIDRLAKLLTDGHAKKDGKDP